MRSTNTGIEDGMSIRVYLTEIPRMVVEIIGLKLFRLMNSSTREVGYAFRMGYIEII